MEEREREREREVGGTNGEGKRKKAQYCLTYSEHCVETDSDISDIRHSTSRGIITHGGVDEDVRDLIVIGQGQLNGSTHREENT